jgi:uncharacterized protein YhdP
MDDELTSIRTLSKELQTKTYTIEENEVLDIIGGINHYPYRAEAGTMGVVVKVREMKMKESQPDWLPS